MEALLLPAILIALGIGFRAMRPTLPPDGTVGMNKPDS